MITHRPRRLDGVSYVGYQRYFVTTGTAFRRPLFTSPPLVTEVTERLLDHSGLLEFAVLAYCVMPDHLHALLEGQSERADLTAFMKRFKRMTGVSYRQQTKQPLWQPGYHERILRDDESTETVIRYILANPVRAGLSNALGEYPFAGSGVYDLDGLLTAWERQT